MIIENRDILNDDSIKIFLDSFEYSIDPIVITSKSPEEHFLYVNEAFKKQTGYTESELLHKSPRILQGKKTNRKVLDQLKEKLLKGEPFTGQNVNYTKDNKEYIVRWHITPLKNKNGEIIAYISYQKEITKSIWNKNRLQLLSSTIDQVDQVVLVTNLAGEIVYVNKAFEDRYGFLRVDTIGRNVNFLKSGKQSRSFYKDIWDTLSSHKSYHGVFINKNKKGELLHERKTITPIKDENGQVSHYVSVAQDITKLVSEQSKYKQKAYTDQLTSLNNRLKLDEYLDKKFKSLDVEKNPFSLVMLDIDNFKFINDTYGHDKGDVVLKNLAKILKKELRRDDLIVRWGGEEFAVVVEDNLDIGFCIAEKLRLAIADKLSINNKSITASLGVAQIKNSDTKESFFKRVDEALYKSKKSGKNKTTSA